KRPRGRMPLRKASASRAELEFRPRQCDPPRTSSSPLDIRKFQPAYCGFWLRHQRSKTSGEVWAGWGERLMNRVFYAKMSAAAVLALGSTGCPSIGTVQKADTLGQGNWEVSIEPGAYGVKVESVNATVPVFN